jgi:hypothetical protein
MDVQLAVDPFVVPLHGIERDRKLVGDFLIRKPLCHQT